jgi:hypothetical protein
MDVDCAGVDGPPRVPRHAPGILHPRTRPALVLCDFGRSGLGRARRLDRLREDLETRSIIVNCANNARQKGKAPPGGRRGFESLAGFWGVGGRDPAKSDLQVSRWLIVPKMYWALIRP